MLNDPAPVVVDGGSARLDCRAAGVAHGKSVQTGEVVETNARIHVVARRVIRRLQRNAPCRSAAAPRSFDLTASIDPGGVRSAGGRACGSQHGREGSQGVSGRGSGKCPHRAPRPTAWKTGPTF